MVRLNPLDYRIALIAVLEIEAQAVLHMLDHRHDGEFPLDRGNDYVFHAGDINGRNVVVATFPAGSNYGTGAAASLASQTKSYFRNLWFGLLVGVAAGLPNLSKTPPVDIRLGDVLVALPNGESAGLISYDLGKTADAGFQILDGGRVLAKTEPVVRSAIGAIKIDGPNGRRLFLPFYDAMKDEEHSSEHSINQTFRDPGQDKDRLYATGPDGVEMLVVRDRRPEDKRTRVWYGPIGSGDKLMKSSTERDRLRDTYNIIGLEMEAAGVMSSLPVGVIRGVCDYGDKHKNKQWQPYAAAMAASYAKAILIKIGQGDEVQVAHAIPNLDVECEMLCDLPSQTDQFFGREAQLSLMKQFLQETDGRKGAVLCGISGSGKTQLARTYVSREQDSFSAVIWIDAASPQTVDHSFSQCADRIRLRFPQLQQASVSVSSQSVVLEWLKRNTSRKWLVVIDGMDNLMASRTLFQSFENVFSGSGAVLITSTNPNMARACRFAQVIVEHLDIGSACSLILWRATGIAESGDEKVQQWTRDAAKILNRYALGLELAGILVSNGIVQMNMPPTIFESKYKQLTSIDPVIWNWAKPHTLFDIFDTLFADLVAKDRVTGHLLTLCSIYGPQEIPVTFLKQLNLDKTDNPALAQEPFHELQLLLEDDLSLNLAISKLHEVFLARKKYAANQSIESLSLQGAVCQWRMATIGIHQSHWIIQALQGLACYLELEVDRERTANGKGKPKEFETFNAFRKFLPMSYRCLHMLENQIPTEQLEAPEGVYASQYYNICTHIAPLMSSIGNYELGLKLFSGAVAYLKTTQLSIIHREKHLKMMCGMAKCSQKLGRLKETEESLQNAEEIATDLYGMSSDEVANIYTDLKDIRERMCVEDAHQQRASMATTGPKLDQTFSEIDESNLADTEQLPTTRWETPSNYSGVAELEMDSLSETELAYKPKFEVVLGMRSHRFARVMQPLILRASKTGRTKAVSFLLDKGDDKDCADQNGETPLSLASQYGHVETVRLLLDRGADPNVTRKDGFAPLHFACGRNYIEIAKLLLVSGAGTDTTDEEGYTPLQFACTCSYVEMVNLLLINGADPNIADEDGFRPLHRAVELDNIEIADLLLDSGADPNIADEGGLTPLQWASEVNSVEVADLLLENGAEPNLSDQYGESPLLKAARQGHVEVATLLLAMGADPNITDDDGETPLLMASEMGCEKVVEALLESGAKPNVSNQYGTSPLMRAILENHVEVATLLLAMGANPNTTDEDGETPFDMASDKENGSMAELLLESGADVTITTKSGWSPIHRASMKGNVRKVELLLAHGVIPDVGTSSGWTPLHWASAKGHTHVVRILLEKGADLTMASHHGWTPLHLAADRGYADIVELFLSHDADLSIGCDHGSTPLHLASSQGHCDIIKLLLENGADRGVVTKLGQTPLLLAARNNQESAVRLLLLKDSNYINVTDSKGRTPLSWAARWGSLAAIDILVTRDADMTIRDFLGFTCFDLASSSNEHREVARRLGHESDWMLPPPEVCNDDIHSTIDKSSTTGFGSHVPDDQDFCSTV